MTPADGVDRRRFLFAGGAAAAGAVALAACNNSNTGKTATTVATPTTVPQSAKDILTLRTASSLEALAVAVYQRLIDGGVFRSAAAADAAKTFVAQHKQHGTLFQGETVKAGGAPLGDANAAVLAQLQSRLSSVSDEASALRLVYDIEQILEATYVANVGNFDSHDLNVATMSVAGIEGRHAAVIGGLINQAATPASGFASASGAINPGTGVS